MDEEIVGVRIITDVTGTVGEDGLWKVSELLTHKRKVKDMDWESREVLATAVDSDYNKALNKCNLTILSYLKSANYDLFSEEANAPTDDIKN